MRNVLFICLATLAAVAATADLFGESGAQIGLGRPAAEAEIRAWDIDIAPTGEGLPPGKGRAKDGARIFAAKCAACHGATGKEGPAPQLIGGHGTLTTDHPVKTVGSYWPYATTLFDYIRRAMPYSAPQSLTPDEVYALVAWLLAQNDIIPDGAVMDAASLPQVRMPNRHGFVSDLRPSRPAQ